jgi:FSR family fosmidomycin resistance protein-like MFS transporter
MARIRTFAAVRSAVLGASVLTVALGVELVDELVDGTTGAALPLIRRDLALTYSQIGLLVAIPLLVGGLLELPVGLLAGQGRRRRRAVLAGGAAFIVSLAVVAGARSFLVLLSAFVIFFPASGAFVGLTQAGLMDADPQRRDQHMARWTLAGSAGAVTGPLLLATVLGAGGGWRGAYLVLAAAAALACLGVACTTRDGGTFLAPAGEEGEKGEDGGRSTVRQAITALRRGPVVRWLFLLEVTDLLGDVLTGFLALYFVDVVHAPPAQAALAVAVRLGAGLAGDVALIHVLERAAALSVLRVSAVAAAVLYPAFLLTAGFAAKLAVLAGLTVATAPWYPLTQAQLYRSLPGRSGVAVSLMSAASLAGGIGPLAVGLLAQRFGLAWAFAALAVTPIAVLGALVCGNPAPEPTDHRR